MAGNFVILNDSKICRDCGGTLTILDKAMRCCKNTPENGDQQDPHIICNPLTRNNRMFCEHCGFRVNGDTNCQNCNQEAFYP